MSVSTVVVSALLGVAFGAVLQRSQVSSPDRIVGTLTLRDLTVLKLMLLAVGVASIGIGGLSALGLAHLKVKPLMLLAVAGGGLVFGLGFALAGYCPGTCLVGAVEGRKDAAFTIAGGLGGALAFALVYPVLKPWLVDPMTYGAPTLAEVSGIGRGTAGLLFGVAMTALAVLLPTRPGEAVSRAAESGADAQCPRTVDAS